ncbi:MAG TPA: ribonuclease H-like domain-containing protein [Alphaproteobacteria bacterium]|nr:ribonuclease H-like domain-containing protein [Alphaproteobacteria bacterium]
MARQYAIIDIETRIDKELVKQVLFQDSNITPEDAYLTYKQKLLDESNGKSDFFPAMFHVPIVIGYGYARGQNLELVKVDTLPDGDQGIKTFWDIANSNATLVTWNGRAFDLPVLELHAIRLGIQAPRYYNEKYGARYRYSDDGHYDLYDWVTNFGVTYFRGGLDTISKIIGLPGKVGEIRGDSVQRAWEEGRIEEIKRYCRRDVVETYGIMLRIELVRGRLTQKDHDCGMQKCYALLEEFCAS